MRVACVGGGPAGLAKNLKYHGKLQPELLSRGRQRKATLLQDQTDARFSAKWFENIPRHIDLKPYEFFALLHARRSPVLPHLPPRLYYQLDQATKEVTVLRALRRRAVPRMEAFYSGPQDDADPKATRSGDSSMARLRADVD